MVETLQHPACVCKVLLHKRNKLRRYLFFSNILQNKLSKPYCKVMHSRAIFIKFKTIFKKKKCSVGLFVCFSMYPVYIFVSFLHLF